VDNLQRQLLSGFVLNDREVNVASLADNRIRLHVSADSQSPGLPLLVHLVQLCEGLVVRFRIIDAADCQVPQRAENRGNQDPELHIFIHWMAPSSQYNAAPAGEEAG